MHIASPHRATGRRIGPSDPRLVLDRRTAAGDCGADASDQCRALDHGHHRLDAAAGTGRGSRGGQWQTAPYAKAQANGHAVADSHGHSDHKPNVVANCLAHVVADIRSHPDFRRVHPLPDQQRLEQAGNLAAGAQ